MFKKIAIIVVLSVMLLSGVSLAANELKVLTWTGYIAPELATKFETTYGAKLIVAGYDTYDQMLDKISKETYDVIITGELIIPHLISTSQVLPLDKAKLPNIANLDPLFKNLSFDPGNKYSLPFHYIYIGLIYNKSKIAEKDVTLQNYFETPANLKGKVTTFPNSRIMVAMVMKYMGQSLNNQEKKNLDLAGTLLKSFKGSVTAKGKDMTREVSAGYPEVISGEAVMAISYCAESTRTFLYNAKSQIGFVIPKEGAIIGTDNMLVSKKATNVDLAHKFINFYYEPKNAAISVNLFGNPFPVKNIKTYLKPEIANDPAVYPPADVVKNLEFFTPMNEAQLAIYDKLWVDSFGK